MSLKFTNKVHDQDLAVDPFELTAKVGRSLVVKKIGVIGHTDESLIRGVIGDKVAFNAIAMTNANNNLPAKYVDINPYSLWETLKEKFPDVANLVIDEDETLLIDAETMDGVVTVEFDEYEGTDRPKRTDPGGSESDKKLFISVGEATANIASSATEIVQAAVSLNVAGISDFPFEENVPVNKQLKLIGLCVDGGINQGAHITIDGIRIWRNNELQLTDAEEFMNPLLFPYNTDNTDFPIHIFDNPINFVPNEKLLIEVEMTNTSGSSAETGIAIISLFFIESAAGGG